MKSDANYKVLKEYVPLEILNLIQLPNRNELTIQVVKPRKSKLGDFKIFSGLKTPRITLNNNLNPFALTITLIHELAHLNVFSKFGQKVKPHGSEWKYEYKLLLTPIIRSNKLPEELQKVLIKSIEQPRASSCADYLLSKTLNKYDTKKHNEVKLESISDLDFFEYNKRVFQRLKLRRTRYLCLELDTSKKYLIHRLADIKKV